ncbi:hypothetical protein M413DRAFT_70185 [Hebeloma cylindrosporum]|uniref:Nodulin-like domain-containing protein n=1 Tax=Hebeloma cylindrosporum TaxID=76867 RepID=A0A0C3C1E5_HEBCY|nr:hypothetical protein M413DRAFT_70185 [Hebeloma cylindrosporum h7]
MASSPAPPPALISVPRITTLIASLLVSLSSGTNYVSFSCWIAYAPQLGAKLGISHTQLNIVALAGNVGVYSSGPIWGRIVDSRGPRILLAGAFLSLLIGYSGIRYLYDRGLPPNTSTLSILGFCVLVASSYLTGSGGNAGLVSAVNSTAKTFPDQARASTTGLVISGFGLSAFFFSSISHLLFAGNTSAFLLVLALGTSFPMIMGFFFVRPIPLPEQEGYEILAHRPRSLSRGAAMAEDTLPNVYGKKLWQSGDFWLLFSILSMLSGTGLMYINNVGSMSQALYAYKNPNYNEVEASGWQATQVSAISLMNFLGRIFIGLVSDLAKNKYDMPRSYSLVLVSFFFFISQVVAANEDRIENLWVASTLLGLAHGSVFSLFPTVCLEWFGMPHFSENWGYLSLSPMAGGNLFSIFFGRNLDKHDVTKTPPMVKVARVAAPQCLLGLECYVDTLYLTAGATFLSMLLSIWAGYRDRRKIAASREKKEFSRRGGVPWEYNEERRDD